MPELRVVLVMVPTLLASLLRHGVAARFGQRRIAQSAASGSDVTLSIVANLNHSRHITSRLRRLAPDVVILGPTGRPPPWRKAALPRHTQVLILSADLARVDGPGPGETAVLTPEVLADLLYRIGQKI